VARLYGSGDKEGLASVLAVLFNGAEASDQDRRVFAQIPEVANTIIDQVKSMDAKFQKSISQVFNQLLKKSSSKVSTDQDDGLTQVSIEQVIRHHQTHLLRESGLEGIAPLALKKIQRLGRAKKQSQGARASRSPL
jgi:hypothetical protein